MRVTLAGLVAQLMLLAALATVVRLGPAGWLVGSGYALTAYTVLGLALHRLGARSFGPANRITLLRAVLVGGVAALIAADAPARVLVPVAATALLMDAVDGLVARREGEHSRLGARFDLEVDAALILLLSIEVAGWLGPWVLAIGAMRYVFVAAGRVLPWLRRPVPAGRTAKAVAAAQGVVLVTVASGLLPMRLAVAGTALALAALTWSFARDVGWLYRNRLRGCGSRPGSGAASPDPVGPPASSPARPDDPGRARPGG
ncbi:MAG TPA: CDP-alcohol phosphatidyltransferase family protein [Actinophytocola sp.]|uniref:CDP-alcohol phosphatidyltransferase family protein n=1 Tax=Actinophytocola sp. TaxID=1872138 RepID=UPI002DB7133E|nr:CDP-alcohol phosphatidyltransferase family protein [Actinophytocola sp.]HEU5475538.1 CDP-alcohol phosphatidyltransferase family protein [Actinophytocola sp.]